ncbi:Vacuolar membrane protease [Nowakowskiella sp. JEL0078]|nr:Vacuolar membrane protease [Nowakowskiella sp. JEL0078]
MIPILWFFLLFDTQANSLFVLKFVIGYKPNLDDIAIRSAALFQIRKIARIWNQPFTILSYFLKAIWEGCFYVFSELSGQYLPFALSLLALTMAAIMTYLVDGPHQKTVTAMEAEFLWLGWWLILGISSSIGFGTGLHTFVMFLGPHIAHVTIAAYTCKSLDIETRGGENSLLKINSYICRNYDANAVAQTITIFQILNKVKSEAFWWGVGTALGELPPYFVARASANHDGGDDEDLASFESVLQKDPAHHTLWEKLQVSMFNMLQKFGFWAILLCASIPNPLFDLAGLVCGRFGIPFYTFFGATFIGKACIKAMISAISVVVLFSDDILQLIMKQLQIWIPPLYIIIKSILDDQVRNFTNKPGTFQRPSNIFVVTWNTLILTMVMYFIFSFVESTALMQMKKEHVKEIELLSNKHQSLSHQNISDATPDNLPQQTN